MIRILFTCIFAIVLVSLVEGFEASGGTSTGLRQLDFKRTVKERALQQQVQRRLLEELSNQPRPATAPLVVRDVIKDEPRGLQSNLAISSNWINRIRLVLSFATGEIPEIGGLLQFLLLHFWPKSSPSIWDLVQTQVESLVDTNILKFEFTNFENEINGLKDSMEMFQVAENKEKGSLLSAMLTVTNLLFDSLTNSKNNICLIPLISTIAVMHLTLLRERYLHGIEMYGENNTKVWLEELTDMNDKYFKHFVEIYPAWKAWRLQKITVEWWSKMTGILIWSAFGEARDTLIGESVKYKDDVNSNSVFFKDHMLAVQERYLNEAIGGMSTILSPMFTLHRFIPSQKDAPAKFFGGLETLVLGPYSSCTLGRSFKSPCRTSYSDAGGLVTSMVVREYNSIDGMAMYYGSTPGHFVGSRHDGVLHNISPPNGHHIVGQKMGFSAGIMFRTEVVFSDGSSTGELGNRRSWSGPSADGVVSSAYQLAGASYANGYGPSNTVGVGCIEMVFSYVN